MMMDEDLFWEYPKLPLEIPKQSSIGQGAFGTVYKAIYDNQKIALKKINTSLRILKNNKEYLRKIKREINIMEVLKDKHEIVQFIGVCISEGHAFIAMQLATNSLYD